MDNLITIPRWFDRHLHIRDGQMMENVFPSTLQQRPIGAVLMGNLSINPTITLENTAAYQKRVKAALPKDLDFTPCMTLCLTDDTTTEEVIRGYQQGLFKAVKIYFIDKHGRGGTTNIHRGVTNLRKCYPVLEVMEKYRIPALGHWEAAEPDIDEFDREIRSIDRDLIPVNKAFPGLITVVEHITDGRTAEYVASATTCLYATVTAHHLMINRNAMFRGGMNPGYYCRPVAKREEDRKKIRQYVTSGHPGFGAGTDSAPHDISAKAQCYNCAAGIFTAPLAVELYTMVFDEDGKLENLGKFLSENFVDIYGMEASKETMTITRQSWVVPKTIHGIPVFMGGREISWKLSS